jgi:tetratricopeptide (TPR) repeat protein
MAVSRLLDSHGAENYDPQYTLVLAKVLNSWQENELAIRFAKEVIRKEPRSYDAWNLIASVYERTNQAEQSVAYRLKTIEFDPRNYDNKLLLALTYQKLGMIDESSALAKQVLKDAPESASSYEAASILVKELQN